jgi:diguanylate cyclase (GGDEF)-like protein
VIVVHDVGVARAMSLRMSYLAQHDFLTELPNRLLNDRLTQAVASAHRHGKYLPLLFLDVDHFKYVNDALGHAIGRFRSLEEKQRIIAEATAPAASVAVVARKHGVNANLVFAWMRLQERGMLAARTRR